MASIFMVIVSIAVLTAASILIHYIVTKNE